jgi:hypothetical protein
VRVFSAAFTVLRFVAAPSRYRYGLADAHAHTEHASDSRWCSTMDVANLGYTETWPRKRDESVNACPNAKPGKGPERDSSTRNHAAPKACSGPIGGESASSTHHRRELRAPRDRDVHGSEASNPSCPDCGRRSGEMNVTTPQDSDRRREQERPRDLDPRGTDVEIGRKGRPGVEPRKHTESDERVDAQITSQT